VLVSVLKVLIDICWKKAGPVQLIKLPCFESQCHNLRFDVSNDHRVDKVHSISMFGRHQRVQESFCGSGKCE